MFISRVFLTSFYSSSSFHCQDVTDLLTEKELYSSLSLSLLSLTRSLFLPFTFLQYSSFHLLYCEDLSSCPLFHLLPFRFSAFILHTTFRNLEMKKMDTKDFYLSTCCSSQWFVSFILSLSIPDFSFCVSYPRFVWLKVFHSSFSSLVWNPCLLWQNFCAKTLCWKQSNVAEQG